MVGCNIFGEYWTMRLLLLVSILVTGSVLALEEDFPLRNRYRDLNILSVEEFYSIYNDVVIIDVRPKYAYDYLHIEGAYNIPLKSPDFIEQMRALEKDNNKPIVFYCFGYDCHLSYDACRQTKKYIKSDNTLMVYDGGLLDWAKRYPDKVKPAYNVQEYITLNRLIDNYSMEPKSFILQSAKDNVILVNFNTQYDFDDPLKFRAIRLAGNPNQEALFKDLMHQAKQNNKTLFIYGPSSRSYAIPLKVLVAERFYNFKLMEGGLFGYERMLLNEVLNARK